MSRLPVVDEAGRRFGCTQCGNCCVQPGYVFFGIDELRAMAEYLKVTVSEFKQTWKVEWERVERRYSIDATDGTGCPLLTADRRCRVHPVKPIQCRTFPFWDEMLEGRTAWDEAKHFCPGLDAKAGRLYSWPEIEDIRRGARGT